MQINMLKSKIHRATVTEANLNYEGSISIDPKLYDAANMMPWEKVEIYNCNNGARFSTYIIPGKEGQIGLNGAAARMVHVGDLVIIASYAQFEVNEASLHQPKAIFVDDDNNIKDIRPEKLPD